MENELMVLPVEISRISQNVSIEKRTEVQTVLNNVFNGVAKMREQLDTVIIVDPNDKVNMKIANTIRLGVRQVRLDAEKIFDAKRAEVVTKMLSYKTEDQLWLKAKQTMQILTKEIEENARWKEETKERFYAEQKELKIQQRIVRISVIKSDISRSEFENMSDEMFEIFFKSIEKAYNDRIEEELQAESERIAKEKAEAEERERIKIENERLKAEAEDKEKQIAKEREESERKLKIEREAAETERKLFEEKARKEREESERKLKAEQESSRIAYEKAKAEKEKLEAEIKAKDEAEENMRKENEAKAIAEQRAKEAAEKKAKNAPDKEKLFLLSSDIDLLKLPEIKGEEAQKILSDVKILLSKVSVFIREKSNLL